MGLSASQARFLQLTARKSNDEYQAQQITFQRLQLATALEDASMQYEEKTTNTKLVYKFNNGTGMTNVDVTYNNYKNYMNQQMPGLTTSQDKLYLVSSSGNKIVVASEEDRQAMIDAEPDKFKPEDFLIVDNLDDNDAFKQSIQDGVYFFAKYEYDQNVDEYRFNTESWNTIDAGVISEELDKTDDAGAEAEYDRIKSQFQKKDKALEMELDRLETERSAIQTEIDSVSKVIDDNIEETFKTFG